MMKKRWQLTHITREPTRLNPPEDSVAVAERREVRQQVKTYFTKRGAEADRRRYAAIGSFSGEYLEYAYEVEPIQ